MNALARRTFIGAGLAGLFASCASGEDMTVNVRDFKKDDNGPDDEAFRAALAPGRTVVVPAGIYRFSGETPIEIPAGCRLIGQGSPSLRKIGAPLQPLFRATAVRGVMLQGLELRGAMRMEREVQLQPGQRKFALPWPIGTPPAIALVLIAGQKRVPLQHGTEFVVRGEVIDILPKVDMTGVEAAFLWREPALCPLVEFNETTESDLRDLLCHDGALWVRGTGNRPLRVAVTNCTLSNGQIRLWGRDNEVTPIQIGLTRSETPNGPRSVRIEGNRLTGRIPSDATKHYLRFGERAAGIEVQSYASDITVTGNQVRGQAGDGIWLASCSDSLIAGNRIENNGLSGIGLETRVIRESQRCTIRDNIVIGNWFDGCDLNFGSGPADGEISISNNTFSGNGFDLKPVSGGCGIFINGVRDAEIMSNLCEDNNIGGIVCTKSEAIHVEGNRCVNNGRSPRVSFGAGAGIGVSGAKDISVVANVCDNGGPSQQRVGIAFASSADQRQTRLSGNRTLGRSPASIGTWDGHGYAGSAPEA